MPTRPKVPKVHDPLDITGRTYKQFGRLLDKLEEPDSYDDVPLPQLINGLKLLLAYDLTAIRKYARDDADNAGSAVRKFEKAFASHAARGRAESEGAKAALSVVAGLDDDGDDPAA